MEENCGLHDNDADISSRLSELYHGAPSCMMIILGLFQNVHIRPSPPRWTKSDVSLLRRPGKSTYQKKLQKVGQWTTGGSATTVIGGYRRIAFRIYSEFLTVPCFKSEISPIRRIAFRRKPLACRVNLLPTSLVKWLGILKNWCRKNALRYIGKTFAVWNFVLSK
jgi:hypothetical protein